MLDIMRQKKRMKAIVLWIVIIAVGGSMVIWGVALNLGGNSGRSALGSSSGMSKHSLPLFSIPVHSLERGDVSVPIFLT